MTGEPLLEFLRRSPVTHPLELPDSQEFLEGGGHERGLTLQWRERRFRSTLQNPFAADLVDSTTRNFQRFVWPGGMRGQKAQTRHACRCLKPSERQTYRDAARLMVQQGTRREEVRLGLLYLNFLGESQDLDASRILAQNGAFTVQALGIIAKLSPTREQDYRRLVLTLQGSEKIPVLALLLRRPTEERLRFALEHGFPSLRPPIWGWRGGGFGELKELRLLRTTAEFWTSRGDLREALLTRPGMAALVAAASTDDIYQRRILQEPRRLTHFFLDPTVEEDWLELILPALESDEEFERRQAWMVARKTGQDLDRLAALRLGEHPDDFVAWEEVVPYLLRADLLDGVQVEPDEGSPAFELGLCYARWKNARVLEPVLRGLSRYPGRRPDLVERGLRHPVLGVRLAALGVAGVWPDDTFLEEVGEVGTSDPVLAVREVARKIYHRRRLRPPMLDLCRAALAGMTEVSSELASQIETSFVIEESVPEGLTAFIKFAHYQNARYARSIAQETAVGFCIVDLDPMDQHVLAVEIL